MYKILILAKYFAPQMGIGSVRWTKISKYLSRLGDYEISVMTEARNFRNENHIIYYSRKDEFLEKDLKCIKHCYEVPLNLPLKIFYFMRKNFQQSRKYGGRSIEVIHEKPVTAGKKIKKELYLFVLDFLDRLWAKNILRYCKKIDIQQYDVIISSHGPFWSSIAASELKRKYPKLVWIADFRDPYASETDTEWSYRRHRRLLYQYCKRADALFRASRRMQTNCPHFVPKKTITNGYDLLECVPPLPSERFKIVYTGTMYQANDVKPVCRAVRELVEEHKIDREDVIIEVYGEGGHMAEKQAREEGVPDLLKNYGLASRKDILKIQQTAAILLQMSSNTKRQKIDWTGKMYEYMMSRKPIIYAVTGDVPYSYPDRYMGKLGGCCYEACRDAETYPLLKKYLFDKYQEWKETGHTSVTRDEKYVSQYSYAEIAKKTDSVFKTLIRKGY